MIGLEGDDGSGRPAGDAVEVASASAASGADEIFITLPAEPTVAAVGVLAALAASLSVPVLVEADTADSGIFDRLLDAGASRIFIERAALDDPDLISRLSRRFGVETLGVTITVGGGEGIERVRRGEDGVDTEWHPVTWGRVVEAQGGGELLFGSAGGRFGPTDLSLLRALAAGVGRPVMAAVGGQGVLEAVDALLIGDADAVRIDALRPPDGETIPRLKRTIAEHGLRVRL